MTNKKPIVKRKVKDSVFTDLFGVPENILQLYQALHPEDDQVKVEDLSDITLENILMNGLYNDLGFRVKEKLIILVEAQSTWSVNIIIRSLFYLAKTYQDYFTSMETNLFRTSPVKMPEPELYVVYTKDRGNRPEVISLKENFFKGKDIAVDIKMKVLYGENQKDIIGQYVMFCKVVDGEIKSHGYSRKTIENAIRICQDRNVLTEYLEKRKCEVMDMYDFLYSEEIISRNRDAEMRREGISIGEKRGISIGEKRKEAQLLKKLVQQGYLTQEQAKSVATKEV